jgi:hypothetical protein
MKKLTLIHALIGITAVVFMVGCDAERALRQVVNANPKGDVKVVPGENYKFIIKQENGDIDIVSNTGWWPDDNSRAGTDVNNDKIILFKAK